jgi:hypothetical protein
VHDDTAASALPASLRAGTTLLAEGLRQQRRSRVGPGSGCVGQHPAKNNRKGSFVFSAFMYRYGNLVARFFYKLKQYRGIATRYDKCSENFLAATSSHQPLSGSVVMSPLSR